LEELETILIKARQALGQNRHDEALAILNEITIANHSEVIFLKGEIYFKLQRWGEALNQFSLFKELNPTDQKAESYCTMIQNILGFYHKDLFNP